MAKLRINDGSGNLLVDAYVNVFKNLILDPAKNDEFVAPQNRNNRPALLQAATGGVGNVVQQTASGSLEVIDNSNCRIDTERDEKRGAGPKSKITIPFPDNNPPPYPSLDYLDDYAKTIHDLYDGDEDDKIKARQFMFAVMMMTRCR